MAINLTPALEERLRKQAEQSGEEVDTFAQALIREALEWNERLRTEIDAAIIQAYDEAESGREKAFDQYLTDQRQRHGHVMNATGTDERDGRDGR